MGDLQRLRELNSLASLRVLRGEEPLTLSELARRTGMSRASIGDVVAGLLTRGWVDELEPAPGGMGRPARRYRFRADAGHVLGLDIGKHEVLAGLADLEGAVVATAREPMPAVQPGGLPGARSNDDRLAVVDAAVTACLSRAELAASDIWAVGVGSTGVVDRHGHVVLAAALPGWSEVDLAGHLRARFDCPVLVENNSNLGALAEHRVGVARGALDVVFLHAGLSSGAGLIIGGRLHHGFSGATGEVGALEAVRWKSMTGHLATYPVPEGTPPDRIAGEVFAAARAGDSEAVAAVGRYAADLAVGTAAMVLTLDPELVVLGGGYSRAGDVLLGPLRQALTPLCLRPPEIRVSSLGEECVVVGAAHLALDHLEREMLSPTGPLADPVAPREAG
ncbi:ROK family transcriptional regulator [Streptosporangium sp. KLBMP 9127]|nr:ROK family transcriptional regulator [Streptosporangium sp. KLBMP 9127]